MKTPQGIGRAVAGLSWVLLLFGLLYLVSAVGRDSGMHWDTVRQSTNAWIGIALLAAAVPAGVSALVVDRPHRRRYHAPGESRTGIQHPAALIFALVAAAVLAAALALIMASTTNLPLDVAIPATESLNHSQ